MTHMIRMKKMNGVYGRLALLGFLVALFLGGASVFAGRVQQGPVSNTPVTIQNALKAAVSDAQNRPELMTVLNEPWQKKLFEEEVVTQFSRFVKDYRPTAAGVQTDVDTDSIKQYLAFYGPKTLKTTTPKIFIDVQVDADCQRCTDSSIEVKKLARARAERRGFVVSWGAPEGGVISGLTHWFIQVIPAPVDDIDSAHAEEKKFLVKSRWQSRDAFGKEYSYSTQLELLENDPVMPGVSRVMTDTLSDLGKQWIQSEQEAAKQSQSVEIPLTVRGIKDFQQYQKLKAGILQALKGQGQMEERKIAQGTVTFAIFTTVAVSDLKIQFSGVNCGSGLLHVVDAEDGASAGRLTAEIR